MNTPLLSAPLLSLIVGGRNDTYMGDFRWRFSLMLNSLVRSLREIGRLGAVEVVVCDWGSEEPIHKVLALEPGAEEVVRFIIVPPEFAKTAQRDSPFPIPIVQNIAIRRSRGTFIAQTDSDIIFSPRSLRAMLNALEGREKLPVDPARALLVCSRRHIPYEISHAKPSLDEMWNYLAHYGSMLFYEQLMQGFATPSCLALLHRDLWEKYQGYDERLIYWGWMEIDLYLRITQSLPWFDLDGAGVNLFHIEHYPLRKQTERKMNPMDVSAETGTGNDNWGYPGESFLIVPGSSSLAAEPNGDWRSGWWHEHSKSLNTTEQVQRVLDDLKGSIHRLSLTPAFMIVLKRYELMVSGKAPPQWDAAMFLSWYSERYAPLRYLELGVGESSAVVHVANRFRCCAIAAACSWPREGAPRVIDRPETLTYVLNEGCRHAGYTLLLSGAGPATAAGLAGWVERQGRFDLICVNMRGIGKLLASEVASLSSLAAPWAPIVFNHVCDNPSAPVHAIEVSSGDRAVLQGVNTLVLGPEHSAQLSSFSLKPGS